jgi:hypothetical protein
MIWLDLPWGLWNGVTAWIVLVVHAFGGWSEFPLYDVARNGNWYGFGFLLGAGSPFLGRRRGREATEGRQLREPAVCLTTDKRREEGTGTPSSAGRLAPLSETPA